jgi:hypothetical protein
MRRPHSIPAISFILFTTTLFSILAGSRTSSRASADQAPGTTYLGFDRNIYPGDDALPVLRKTFSFASYWLSPPPGEKVNRWRGKRELLRSHGFGFAVLYRARPSSEIRTETAAKQKGALDAHSAATSARTEGFAAQTIVFLDIEEGGRLPAAYHAYLRAWTDELARAGYRAGVYCSGIPVDEGGGVNIITADDIRHNIGARRITYWVYNDVCPPSPGCNSPQNPPPVSASGVSYAAVWQFSQSPRRKKFTEHCAATYQTDGNCYAPGDIAHAWFLDVNTAISPDPSSGARK